MADADEPTLLRAAYNLRSDAVMPEAIVAEAAVAEAASAEAAAAEAAVAEAAGAGRAGTDRRCHGPRGLRDRRTTDERRDSTGRTPAAPAPSTGSDPRRTQRLDLGLLGFLVILLAFTKLIQPSYGVTGVQGLAISVLPLALAAVAQAVVVISGGIDLSIGSMMALDQRGRGRR